MSHAQRAWAPSTSGPLSKSPSSAGFSAPSDAVINGRLVFSGAGQPVHELKTTPRGKPQFTGGILPQPGYFASIRGRGVQPKKLSKSHMETLQRSALAQSSRPYIPPYIPVKPPWNKRHHIIHRSKYDDKRTRLRNLLQQFGEELPAELDVQVPANEREAPARAHWMQPGRWYPKQEFQQQEQERSLRGSLEDDEDEFPSAPLHSVIQSKISGDLAVDFTSTHAGHVPPAKNEEPVLRGAMRRGSNKNSKVTAKSVEASIAAIMDEANEASPLPSPSDPHHAFDEASQVDPSGSLPPKGSSPSMLNGISEGQTSRKASEGQTSPQVGISDKSQENANSLKHLPGSQAPEAPDDHPRHIPLFDPLHLIDKGDAKSLEKALNDKSSSRLIENLPMPTEGGDTCLVTFGLEETKILRGFFDLHDADGSNSLSLEELTEVVDDIGRAPEEGSEDALEFQRLMYKADASGDEELNFEEFRNFLCEYYQSVYWRLFLEADEDGSKTISKFEIKGLMVKLKDSGFKVRGEDIAGLFDEIDNSNTEGDGVLDWHEFCDFMSSYRRLEFALLKDSAGFPAPEMEFLRTIYDEADSDHSGQLAIREVVDLLERTMLGSKVDTQEEINKIVELFARIDKDKSMSLDFIEFLRLLRVWSNNKKRGKKEILAVFKKLDELQTMRILPDGTGQIVQNNDASPKVDLDHDVVKGLRTSIMARTRTSLENFGIEQEGAEKEYRDKKYKLENELRNIAIEMDVEDGILAKTCGLTIGEVRVLRESFEFCDRDGSGYIDPDELTVILKTLGCAPITPSLKQAFAKTRECEEFKGELDFANLVRFLVQYHATSVEMVVSWAKFTINDETDEGVLTDKLVHVLYQMGQYLNRDGAMSLLKRVGGDPEGTVVSKKTFLKMIASDRTAKLAAWRQTCGFSESQIKAIKNAFATKCSPDDDAIMNRDGRVLEALHLLDIAPPSDTAREQLMRALLKVDRAATGTITFHDFLLLVRQLENQNLYKRTQKEKENIKVAGLDADAVQQFRQIFDDCKPNDYGRVGILRIHQLFADLGLVKKQSQRKEVQDVITEVTGIDKSGLAFHHFLEVLHRLEKSHGLD